MLRGLLKRNYYIDRTEMLKVDLVYSNYLNSPDGASRFVKSMSGLHDNFLKCDIDLRVITPDLFSEKHFDEGVKENPSIAKRIVRRISRNSAVVTWLRIHRAIEVPAKRIIDFYENYEDKGDVIAFQEGVTAYYFLKRRKDKDQKVLLTLHNNGEIWSMIAQNMPRINSILLKGYRDDFEKTLFTGCDNIGFVADTPRRRFCSLYPYNEKRTYFCYNGVEPHPYPERKKSATLDLVCVGSVNERKNQMGVLKAMGLLPKEYQKKITFRVVGDGTAMTLLKEEAARLSAKIIFVGNSNEVDKHLLLANCFVLYSKDEGLPISIIEGMRSGLPIIGSRIAGIPEQVIEGKTGFLVDLDEHQLAETMKFCVDHIDDLEEMGKASYEYFLKKFTIDAMVRKYAEIYKSAAQSE